MRNDRIEKYLLGRAKERVAIDLTLQFLSAVCGIAAEKVLDADANYLLGDLVADGRYFEVKGQGINPNSYGGMNYVELFETPHEDKEYGSFEDLAAALGIDPEVLAMTNFVPYAEDENEQKYPLEPHVLGRVQNPSVSISNFASAQAVIYASNSNSGNRFIYVYEPGALLDLCRPVVLAGAMTRGRGKSNLVTFAVQIPVPPHRWMTKDGVAWRFVGPQGFQWEGALKHWLTGP